MLRNQECSKPVPHREPHSAGAAGSPPLSGWRVTAVRSTLVPTWSHCARATTLRAPAPHPHPERARARGSPFGRGRAPWKIPLPSSLHPMRLFSCSVHCGSTGIPAAFARTKWQPPYRGACPAYPGLWDGGLGRWVGTRQMKF